MILPLPHLPASLHSIGCRLLVSIILNLPCLPPGTISSDPSVYTELHRTLLRVSRGLLLSPTNSHVGRSLDFVISALENGASDHSVRVVPFTPFRSKSANSVPGMVDPARNSGPSELNGHSRSPEATRTVEISAQAGFDHALP